MIQYIDKAAVVAEIEKRKDENLECEIKMSRRYFSARAMEDIDILSFLDTLEVKEVNEVPATVMVNKYGNRFISSWPGLKEYDGLKEGQEIKIIISKS